MMKKWFFTALFGALACTAAAQSAADSVKMDLQLDEVAITAHRKLTKQTDTGYIYHLKEDKAAQTMNMMDALRRVPLVTIAPDGKITVQGCERYAIYLNGRSYHIAQSAPKATLEGIPASSVEQVEIITRPDGRYDAEAGDVIINIITVKNALDGYSLSLTGSAQTQPQANAGTTLLANKGKVNFSAGYNYDLNVQLDQPASIDYDYYYPNGTVHHTTRSEVHGDGRWKEHLGRLMLEWAPDSLHTCYADAHALIRGTDFTIRDWSTEMRPELYLQRRNTSHQHNWTGTAESNIIYRSYYPNRRNMDRLTLGYRFTYNPDKRTSDYESYPDAALDSCTFSRTRTDGRLLEHTLSVDYALPLADNHTLRFGAKQILRYGRVESDYLQRTDDSWTPIDYSHFGYAGAMTYAQHVSALYLSYTGRIRKVLLTAALRGEYNYNRIVLTDAAEHFSRHFWSLFPRLGLQYPLSSTTMFTASYNSAVTRPNITVLNPFVQYDSGQIVGSQGDPETKPSRSHTMQFALSHNASHVYLYASLIASHESNAIFANTVADPQSGIIAMREGNFGRHEQLTANFAANFRHSSWLSLTVSLNGAEHWLRCPEIHLRQNSPSWTTALMADFTCPHGWSLGGQVACFGAQPRLHCTFRTMMQTYFYLNKSCLQGRLTLGLTAMCPFKKFRPYETTCRTETYRSSRHNDVRSRSFGFKVVYNINGGKRVNLKRDHSLQNSDQRTGVE